jgi:4-hydroxy-tetrahydrodipicolinate reductase
MAKVGIVGSTGRMGEHLINNVLENEALTLSALHVYDELKVTVPSDVLVTNSMKALLEVCDVVIDFSAPVATQELCEEALKNPTALVIATTGFTAHQQNLLTEASKEMLGEFAAKGRGLDLDAVRVSGRDGQIGARTKDEIAVMALRGGDIVGRHTVGFYNDGEFLELNHTATSRETFSKGAIRAAIWLVDQESGLYSINDCLGI